MAAIKRFEDLIAWQKARTLVHMVYQQSTQEPLAMDHGLKSQLQRASVSVMSNIAEGFGYNSDRQFLRFLGISRASACEVQSLLYVALDSELIDPKSFDEIQNLSHRTITVIAALQRSLRGNTKKQ